MLRLLTTLVLIMTLVGPISAQQVDAPEPDRSATGGAPTLEDIMARQRGEEVDNSYRQQLTGDPDSAASMTDQLGTLGGASDPDLWRALRFGTADVTVSTNTDVDRVLMQERGMWWLEFREGPLATYGGYLLLATLALLAIFYLVRGRIRIEGERTGRTITRFGSVERFGHWLLAGSFVLLGVTGLVLLFGRLALEMFSTPGTDGYVAAREAYATFAMGAKWIHNNVSWAFMLALILIFVMWVLENIPNRHDAKWLAVGGGLFSKHVHPPAKKFNAGQKLIFWSVVILGASISASGLSLLFPFELPMFAKTFALLNDTGIPQAIGFGVLPEQLAPHEEMQFAQLWHAIVSFVLMAIVIAHIYIGSVGMEGAYAAMGSGEVDEQWAREHHSLWVEEMETKADASGRPAPTPAE